MAARNQVFIDIIGKYSGQGALQKFNSDVGRSVNNYKGLIGQVTNLNRTINVFGATIRQVGQGLQNLGTTMTAFVSLPVGLLLKSATSGLLQFDEQLIEIRKNAGLSFDSLDQVKDGLVALSRETPTALTGLGEIAAMAGRAGIIDPSNILGFVKVIDQLSVATTLNVEESGRAIARLANIFYKPTESAQTYIEFLNSVGSAINELGQNIVGSEKEIVSATLRMAPSGAALGIPVQAILGIAAALVETNTSAERTGTQANRALSELAANSVKIAEALGLSVDAFREMIDSNPVEAFLATAEAIGAIESPTLRAMASEQLFGQIGGKVVNVLGELTEEGGKVYKTIAIANRAFEDGVSLQMEFERSLDAVSNQLKLVRNNLNVMAVTVGDVVLPVVSKILSFAVPVVRMMADAFDALDDKVKLAAVGFVLLLAVIGPLLFAVGSLMFSIGIITTGLTTAVAGLFSVVTAPVRFIGAILGMLTPMRLVIITLGALIGSMAAFGGSIPTILSSLGSLASGFYAWGSALVMSFASGMKSALSGMVSIVTEMLSFISVFFKSNSPPKAGPLKDMDTWGRNVAQSFVDGFRSARMGPVLKFGGLIAGSLESALRSVSGTSASIFNGIKGLVSSAATALGNKQGFEDEVVDSKTLKAIESVANAVMGIVNSGSAASDAINGMRDSLGPFVDDFLSLIDIQKRYNNAVSDLNDIRKEQGALDSNLQKEIERISAMSDITAAERAALIRGARLRKNAREKELSEQEKSAEAQVESTKNQVDAQEALISSLVDALKTSTANKDKESDDVNVPGFDIGGISTQLQSAKDALDAVFANSNEEGGRFILMVSEAERVIKAFLAGFRGDDIGSIAELFLGDGSGDVGVVGKAFLFGKKIKTEIDEVKGYFDDLLLKVEDFKTKWNSLLSGDLNSVFTPEQLEAMHRAVLVVGGLAAALALLSFGPAILSGLSTLLSVLGAITAPMLLVAGAVVILGAALWDMTPSTENVSNGFALIWLWATRIYNAFTIFFLKALSDMGVTADDVAEAMKLLWGTIVAVGIILWEVFKVVLEGVIVVVGGLLTVLSAVVGYVLGALVGAFVVLIGWIISFGNWIENDLPAAVESGRQKIQWFFDNINEIASTAWALFVGLLKVAWDNANPLPEIIAYLYGLQMDMAAIGASWGIALTNFLEHTVPDAFTNAGNAISEWVTGIVSSVAGWGGNIAQAFIDGWSSINPVQGITDWIGQIVPIVRGWSPPKEGPLASIDTWGSNIASSFIASFSGSPVDAVGNFAKRIGDALTSGMMSAIRSAEKELVSVATVISEIVARGFAMSSSNAADYMDSILMASGLWILRRSSVLKSFGASISGYILAGFSSAVEDSIDVFDIISDTFASWRNLFFSGTNQIVSVARDIGESMAQAIAEGIASKSVVVGAAIVDMIKGVSLGNNSELANNANGAGQEVAKAIADSISLAMSSIASVSIIGNGIASALYTLVGQVRSAIGAGGPVYAAAFSLGIAIADAIRAGVDLNTIINSNRSGDRTGITSLPSYSGVYEGLGDSGMVQNVNITITGDVIVDNERRMNDLADQVAYRLGRNAQTRYRMGGASA